MEKQKVRNRNGFRIEVVSPHFAEQILEFRRKIYDENEPTTIYTTKKEPPTLESIREKARVSANKPAHFLAIRENNVIGEAMAYRNENGIEIAYGVSKEARGTGVIYALLNKLAGELEKNGIKSVAAITFSTNIVSARLLERIGGKIDSSFSKTYLDEKRNINHKSAKYIIEVTSLKRNAKEKLKQYDWVLSSL